MRGAAGVSRASSASSENDDDRFAASAGDIDTIVRPRAAVDLARVSPSGPNPTHSLRLRYL